MNCSFCAEPSVRCTTVQIGERPADPRKHGTPTDTRKIVVVRVCAAHVRHLGRAGR